MKNPIVIIAALIVICLLWAFAKTDKPTAQAPQDQQATAQPVNVMTDDEKRESENARKIAEAQKAFDAKNVDKPVYAELPSESRIMDFDECKNQTNQSHHQKCINTQTFVGQTIIDDIF